MEAMEATVVRGTPKPRLRPSLVTADLEALATEALEASVTVALVAMEAMEATVVRGALTPRPRLRPSLVTADLEALATVALEASVTVALEADMDASTDRCSHCCHFH